MTKIKELQKILSKKGIDFAVFYWEDPNIRYFSNYTGYGCMTIPKNKSAFLAVPKMEYEKARKMSSVKVISWNKNKKLFQLINDKLKSNSRFKAKKIGINESNLVYGVFKALKKQFKARITDISSDCLGIRQIKTDKEIWLYKKACKLNDKILMNCFRNFKSFRTEHDVVRFLDYESKKYGCELAFSTIVASGKNGSIPHYEPKNVKLNKGFCVIDFGIKYKNYCCDITRTIYIGNPSKKELFDYELVLKTQENIIKLLKIGKKCSEIYSIANKALGKKFIHGLGHGVGVEIHESPNLKPHNENKLQENMIFTVEPGIYLPGKYGIRIEDDVLLTKKGAVVLTKTPKHLLII